MSQRPATTQRAMDSSQYNPEQDPEERRQLRKDYRDLLKNVADDRESIQPDALANQIDAANSLYDKVKTPSDATLDARFLKMAAELGTQRVLDLQLDFTVFSRETFFKKLAQLGNDQAPLMEGDKVSFSAIGQKAASFFTCVPDVHFLLGPLGAQPKVRQVTRREKDKKKSEAEVKEQQPELLQKGDIKQSENETGQNVIRVRRRLEELGEPVPLYKFICNPQSFGQTVENLFHLAFLIKDDVAQITVDDKDVWVAACMEQDVADVPEKAQQIPYLNYQLWQEMIRRYDLVPGQSMIPHRPPVDPQQSTQGKW